MSAFRLLLLLCASFASSAAAEEAFVTQLRMPARGAAVDAFAWRSEAGIAVERSALERLGVALPPDAGGDRVLLTSAPGLSYREDAAAAAIVLSCTAECLPVQHLGAAPTQRAATARPWGAYLNYDVAGDWHDDDAALGAVGETNLFGPLGRGELSWLARSETGVTRLETRWTVDLPQQRLRLRFGDAATVGAGGGHARFAGVQVGRYFGFDPSFMTRPAPVLSGEAEAASTVELYVDGALRARERVQAGPFAFDTAPYVTGAGEAALVVRDVLGREQIVSRPFFVSADLLRPGLSDWSVSLGAERHDYSERSFSYGRLLAAARYRRGLANGLTGEAALDANRDGAVGELAATIAERRMGALHVARAQGRNGGVTAISYFHDARNWSAGAQLENRDADFEPLGGGGGARRTAAASFNVELGRFGSAGFTAASATFAEGPTARTLTLAYTPELPRGGLSLRLGVSERERRSISFGVSYSAELRNGMTGSYGVEADRRGASVRAGLARPPPDQGGLGWRARAVGGDASRVDLSVSYAGAWGESAVRAVHMGDQNGLRVSHAGAVGWVAQHGFAGAPIRGAFALVDAGAADVGVTRDRFRAGRTDRNGVILVTNLRPYEVNAIAVTAADLPMDQVLAASEARVAPAEGAGVVVRFDAAAQRLRETRVRFDTGGAPERGATLVRLRDGARFPVGRDGRVVLLGAAPGDRLRLEGTRCEAGGDGDELLLRCAA